MLKHHSKPAGVPPIFLIIGGVVLVGIVAWVLLSLQSPFVLQGNDSACQSVARESYGISPAVFEALPSPPDCLLSISSAFSSGKFTDTTFFTSDYYLQPEFYPNFMAEGLPQWQNPVASHFGLVGLSSYPFESRSGVLKGGEKSFRFFIHSGYGVRSYQAVRLEAVLENQSDDQFVSLSLDEDSSTGFVLGPTFPLFSSGWVHPVELKVTMSANAPYKEYRIHLRSVPVSSAFIEAHTPSGTSLFYDATYYVGPRILNGLTVVPS